MKPATKISVLAAVLALGIACPAMAEEKASSCAMLGEIARAVMTSRQAELPLSDLLAQVDKAALADPEMRYAWHSLIMTAYKSPSYPSEEVQRRVIAKFGNAVELACYERADK